MSSRTTLKGYFQAADMPTEAQFADLIDSQAQQTDLLTVQSIANLAWGQVSGALGGWSSLGDRLNSFVMVGGNISTLTAGGTSAGQAIVNVDSTTGFIAGARVAYKLAAGVFEYNIVSTVDSATRLTMGTNVGAGGIADNSLFTMISESEYQAAQSIQHSGTLTLPAAMEYAGMKTFNVKAFGATGNGSTDDTTAIQAAINAAAGAGGGTVYLPQGTYLCDELRGGNNVIIQGIGWPSVLKVPDGAGELGGHLFLVDSKHDMVFADLTFDGNLAGQTVGGPTGGTMLLGLIECSNIHISRCKFLNNLYIAIRMEDWGTGGVNDHIWVEHCLLETTDCGISDQSHGSRNINIIGNIFDGGTSEGVSIYTIDGYYSDTVNVVGNIALNKTVGGGIQIARCKNFSITGNVTRNCAVGIRLVYGSGDAGQDPCENGAISGNSIFEPVSSGMDIYGKRVAITGNSIVRPAQNGIILEPTTEGCNVAGNVIEDACHNGSSGAAHGILVTGAKNCDIQNNMIVDTRVTSLMGSAIYVVDNATTHSANTRIAGNRIQGKSAGYPIRVGSGVTGTRIEGNYGNGTSIDLIANAGTSTVARDNFDARSTSVASSATLALPSVNDFFTVTGTTAITGIATSGTMAGRRVTLQFAGILTFTDGGNLDINGNMVTAAGATITLYCDGTNWIEISRVTR